WAILRGARRALGPAEQAGHGPERARPRTRTAIWWGGIAAGAAIGLLLEPMFSIVPYGFDHPVLRALATAAAFAAGAWLVRALPLEEPAFTLGLGAGVLAFALHGFV